MKVKLFTLRFSEENGFDTEEMDQFSAGKKILAVYEHFFVHDYQPCWAIMLSYEEQGETREQTVLTGPQERLWAMLKTWRAEKAKQERHPACFVLHDKQLLEIVKTLPEHAAGLTRIRGIGENKAQKYGAEILGTIELWRKASESPLPSA